MCTRHENKDFLKYNLTEKRLLCEECLSSDKLRRCVIWEISQGYEYERDNFQKSCNLITPIQNKIQTIYQLVFDSISEIKEKFEVKANLIDKFFDDYRNMLDQSQNQVKNFLFLQTQKQISLMEQQKHKTESNLESIYEFVQFQNTQFSETDFLQQVKSKYVVLQSLASEIGTQVSTPTLAEFQKGALFDNLTSKVKSKMGLQRAVRRTSVPKKIVGQKEKAQSVPKEQGFFTEQELVLIFNMKARGVSRTRPSSMQSSRARSLGKAEVLSNRATQQSLKTMNFTQKTERPSSRTSNPKTAVPPRGNRTEVKKPVSRIESKQNSLKRDTSRGSVRTNIKKPPVSPIRKVDRQKNPQKAEEVVPRREEEERSERSNKIDRSSRVKQSQSFIKQVQGFSNETIIAGMGDKDSQDLVSSYQFNHTDQGFYKREDIKSTTNIVTVPTEVTNEFAPQPVFTPRENTAPVFTPVVSTAPIFTPVVNTAPEEYLTIEAVRMSPVNQLEQQPDDTGNMSLADYYNHFISKETQPLSNSQSNMIPGLQQQHDSNTTLEMESIFKDSHPDIQ